MNTKILEDLGLSNAEVKIYIALLELGQSKTGQIIDKTNLQSSTVYHIIGSLIKKGLVSYIQKGKIKFYQATNPDNLISFLDEKKKNLNKILPELKSKEEFSKNKQNAKVYEGLNGVKAAYEDILRTMKKGEEYYFFQFDSDIFSKKQVSLFFRNYHLKRAEKGIKVKGIATTECRKEMKTVYETLKHTKIKYVNEFLPNGIVIYKGKVITLDWGERPAAFVIESGAIYNSYKRFFEKKWKDAK